MSKTLELLIEMINEDKIEIKEILEALEYKFSIIQDDVYANNILIGFDEKIIFTKEFR